MLKSLTIKNYALIDEMHIEFGNGLNILTGETGAGKSIIIGALGFLLGEKARTDVVRKGASMAVVEGLFQVYEPVFLKDVQELIELDCRELLLRRELHVTGRSRSFANDSVIALNTLLSIGDRLIDLHGQHDHQTLLKVQNHLSFIDNYGDYSKIVTAVRDSYREHENLFHNLVRLQEKDKTIKDRKEILEFQLKEINQVDPKEGEEESLEQEEKWMRNSEKLFQCNQELTEDLHEGDGAVSEKLVHAEKLLQSLKDVDPQFEKWANECTSSRIMIEEILNSVQVFVSKIDFNPERLEKIRERLALFNRLKKKFGGSMNQVISYRTNSENELIQIQSLEGEIQKVKMQLDETTDKLMKNCLELSSARIKTARSLEAQVIKALKILGLQNAVFRIDIDQRKGDSGTFFHNGSYFKVSEKGIDQVEFFISVNQGEAPMPLARIASGGEISRIMLALKVVLAEADSVPVMVFDEIDTGISGRIARVVGKNLKSVSRNRQVICITHLAQIASLGEFHFSVKKKVIDGRTQTMISALNESERIGEIAYLIGGDQVTESVVQSARELIQLKDIENDSDG